MCRGRGRNTEGADARAAISALDVVALLVDVPEHGLVRGQVGTVVERLGDGMFEVEFSDDDGRAHAAIALNADALLLLHRRPVIGVHVSSPTRRTD